LLRPIGRSGKMLEMQDLEVRFAEHAGDYLAFAVFGEGRHDVVVQQAIFPIDLMWELPQLAAFMEALGRVVRLIVYDSRGCGASDPITDLDASLPETLADDLLAVLDAVGSDRATVLDMSVGGAVFFGATYPERTRSLILANLRTSYPEFSGFTAAQRKQLALRLRSPEWLRIRNPRVAHDPVLQRWWGRASRLIHSPEGTMRQFEIGTKIDYEPALPVVRVPTLVLHRRDNRLWDIETSRAAASRIPGARFVELPGAEHDLFLGDTAPVLAEIERFLDEPEIDAGHDRPVATVLFTDIQDSTEQLAARGDDAWRHVLDTHDQTMDQSLPPTGDGSSSKLATGSWRPSTAPRELCTAPPRFSTTPATRASRCGPDSTQERSSSDRPTSPGSRSTPPVGSRRWPIRTRSSYPEPLSTSPPDPAFNSRRAESTNSRAYPAVGHSLRLNVRRRPERGSDAFVSR
jgi:pimeloyl-ACP methyl ester carboxylesterase